jgi:hypothetical protein
MRVAKPNYTWNGQISSFNGRCRVTSSLVNGRSISCLIVRSTIEINFNKFKKNRKVLAVWKF